MIEKKKIKNLVDEKLQNTEKFLVDIKIKSGNKILVFLDSDKSITIKDCADINRYIISKLDKEKEDFELRVSSAGLDKPFKLLRQYKKNIGKEVEITLHNGIKKSGILLSVDNKSIDLKQKINKKIKEASMNNNIHIPFNEIKCTKSVIPF